MTAAIPSDDLDTLHEQRAHVRAQLLKVAAQIREIVIKDIPRFMERETRWRWVQHIEFASGMTDAQIREIKEGVGKVASELRPQIEQELSEEEVWCGGEEPVDNKSLESNAQVWSILQTIAGQLAEFLGQHKFPTDPAPEGFDASDSLYRMEYRTPAYFLDGSYCPRLIENYWSHVDHMRKIDGAIDGIRQASARKELEARWNRV